MRHHPLQPIRALIFASAFLLVVGQGTLATYAEPPSWNDSPVLGVVRLAPLDRLQQDFAFLADGVGGGEAATAILDALIDLSDGIDPRRPSGAVVYFDETYAVPADPMVLFEGTDPTLTSYAAFHFAQFPAELRSEIIEKIGEEATFEVEGTTVSRPIASAIEMAIGEPSLVAAEVSGSVSASPEDDRSGNLVDVQVASFTAEQIRTWRAQLGQWAMMPESAPEGWSKSRNDPAKLLTLFPKLKVRQGYVLRAYQFREEGNGNGFVWALPVDAEFPEPDESPRLQGHFLNPPKPFDALDDLMEAIEGDDSPESYLHASILRRQWSEFGAGWHGIDWGTHTVLDDSPWKGGPPRDDEDPGERPASRPGEWKWLVAQPDDWKPQVRLEPNRAIVTFYTYTALAKDGPNGEMERERVVRHTDTYRRGKYRALVTEKKIAEGPDALAF